MDVCDRIDEEIIELEAMSRLPEGVAREHVISCLICQARVSEYRVFVERLKVVLRDWQRGRESRDPSTGPDDSFSQEDA